MSEDDLLRFSDGRASVFLSTLDLVFVFLFLFFHFISYVRVVLVVVGWVGSPGPIISVFYLIVSFIHYEVCLFLSDFKSFLMRLFYSLD